MYNHLMSNFFSGQGDDGFTGLFGKGRVPKHHPRPDAFGVVDEASAALGMVRAQLQERDLHQVLIEIQRDLYTVMAEIATISDTLQQETQLTKDRVGWIEARIEQYGTNVKLPSGFVVPGDNSLSALLDFARTQVRRAERKVSRLLHENELQNPHLLPYLNRLSSFCFLLSVRATQQEGIQTTMAKPEDS
jgi:cob(I)alamin adenosyltransferase